MEQPESTLPSSVEDDERLIPIARAELRDATLAPFERLVAARIDGRRSIDELIVRCAVPPARVRAVLARLVERGLVHLAR